MNEKELTKKILETLEFANYHDLKQHVYTCLAHLREYDASGKEAGLNGCLLDFHAVLSDKNNYMDMDGKLNQVKEMLDEWAGTKLATPVLNSNSNQTIKKMATNLPIKRNSAKAFIADTIEEIAAGNSSFDDIENTDLLHTISRKIDDDNLYLNKLCMEMISDLSRQGIDTAPYIDRLAMFF